MTAYVIFRLEGGQGLWRQGGANVEARSAAEAIRKTVENLDGDKQSGTYAAVPLRSWQPVKVGVETQTRIVLGAKGAADEPAPKATEA